jgi:hypothetical protein
MCIEGREVSNQTLSYIQTLYPFINIDNQSNFTERDEMYEDLKDLTSVILVTKFE